MTAPDHTLPRPFTTLLHARGHPYMDDPTQFV